LELDEIEKHRWLEEDFRSNRDALPLPLFLLPLLLFLLLSSLLTRGDLSTLVGNE
jgi:hypothetical protein